MNKLNAGTTTLLALGLILGGCGKKSEESAAHEAAEPAAVEKHEAALGKGVGPIQSVTLGNLDMAMVERGEKLFSGTCSACHKMEQRYVGPALSGVTKRRSPEWIMNMVLNPSEMTQKDETAKALLGEYMTQMSVAVTPEDARAVLEYFRKQDGT